MRKAFLLVPLALLLLWAVSCEPVQEGSAAKKTDFVAGLSDIPAEYGELQAVTIMPEYPGWFQLWFEDEAGTIRMVRIQPAGKLMHQNVLTIPRSGATAPTEEEAKS